MNYLCLSSLEFSNLYVQEINEKMEVEVINLRKEVEVKEEESKEVQSKLSMVGINNIAFRDSLSAGR